MLSYSFNESHAFGIEELCCFSLWRCAFALQEDENVVSTRLSQQHVHQPESIQSTHLYHQLAARPNLISLTVYIMYLDLPVYIQILEQYIVTSLLFILF